MCHIPGGYWVAAIISILLIALYRLYFVGQLKPAPNSNILGTHTVNNNIFHQLLLNDAACTFKHDGIILCFEKVYRNRLIRTSGVPGFFSVEDQYRVFDIDPALPFDLTDASKRLIASTLDDSKPIALTHWIETGTEGFNIQYNAYETLDGDYNIPGASIVQYQRIAEFVQSKIASGQYTHLILACTGWNNYQDMSLDTYHQWLSFTKNAAHQDGQGNRFKPLFIGFTWPSRWRLPIFSFFNKANDADELGMTHISALLWKYLAPTLTAHPVPVISIGHSFGARVMSRAIHSRFLRKSTDNSYKIDLAIDFQGAYPASRFCEKNGSNGGLYNFEVPVKKHVMTRSRFDHAIKQALYSCYIGNSKSATFLQESVAARGSFEFGSVNEHGMPGSFGADKTRLLLDAHSIIHIKSSFLVGAHGDVRNQATGRMIWEFINKTQP